MRLAGPWILATILSLGSPSKLGTRDSRNGSTAARKAASHPASAPFRIPAPRHSMAAFRLTNIVLTTILMSSLFASAPNDLKTLASLSWLVSPQSWLQDLPKNPLQYPGKRDQGPTRLASSTNRHRAFAS